MPDPPRQQVEDAGGQATTPAKNANADAKARATERRANTRRATKEAKRRLGRATGRARRAAEPYPVYVSTVGSDDFLDPAVRFFEHWQDHSAVAGVQRVSSLEELVDKLAGRDGAIERFTLVTHARDTLHIPLLSGGDPPKDASEGRAQLDAPHDLKNNGTKYVKNVLGDDSYGKSSFAQSLTAVRDSVGADTTIDVRGCRIGTDETYLKRVASFFGRGAPTVTAPKQWYYYGELGPVASLPPDPPNRPLRDSEIRTSLDQLFDEFGRSAVAAAFGHWTDQLPDVSGGTSFSRDALWSFLGTYPLVLARPGESTSLAVVVRTDVEADDPFARWLDECGGPTSPLSASGDDGPGGTPVDWMQTSFHDDPNTPAVRIFRPDGRWEKNITTV